jgi:D-galactarolactone cycloisomerase
MSGSGRAVRLAEVFVAECPVTTPAGPSVATYTSRSAVLVRLQDGAGTVGWGETYRRTGTAAVLAESVPALLGEHPGEARRLLDRLAGLVPDRYALSALSIALDDLRARQAGVRVADLYGGPRRTAVRGYASSGGYVDGTDPEVSWPEETRRNLADGFSACKIRIGRLAPGRELPILEKIRTDVGDGIDLMVDANGAYSVPTARAVGHRLAALGFRWFEEPLIRHAGGLEYPGYELLADLDVPIAAGEGLQTRTAFADFLRRGAASIVQPDVSICGGIGELLFVAELAALSGRLCVPHAWGGAVHFAAAVHAVSLIPEPSELPGIDSPLLECDRFENPLASRLAADPIRPDGGYVRLPDGPGLGITVDEDWLSSIGTRVAVQQC